jgi:hypothetical protein
VYTVFVPLHTSKVVSIFHLILVSTNSGADQNNIDDVIIAGQFGRMLSCHRFRLRCFMVGALRYAYASSRYLFCYPLLLLLKFQRKPKWASASTSACH